MVLDNNISEKNLKESECIAQKLVRREEADVRTTGLDGKNVGLGVEDPVVKRNNKLVVSEDQVQVLERLYTKRV